MVLVRTFSFSCLMSRRKHPAPEQQHIPHEKPKIVFSFDLSLSGILGIGAALFCLFLWMFLLGIWAGQTFLNTPLAPAAAQPQPEKAAAAAVPRPVLPMPSALEPSPKQAAEEEIIVLVPGERKKRIAPPPKPAAE